MSTQPKPAPSEPSSLSPEEQKLYRMYGKLPIAKHLSATKSRGRKYFDSGDYALAKAGKSNVTVGTMHPSLARNNLGAVGGVHPSTSPLNDANITDPSNPFEEEQSHEPTASAHNQGHQLPHPMPPPVSHHHSNSISQAHPFPHPQAQIHSQNPANCHGHVHPLAQAALPDGVVSAEVETGESTTSSTAATGNPGQGQEDGQSKSDSTF